ncbi:MAG: hypothetical protein AAGA73_00395 [Pseudomonadota bacterium]
MADPIAITAVSSTDTPRSSWSLATYQQWLMSSGHIPIAQMMPQHPSQVAVTAASQASNLSRQWRGLLSSTDVLLATGAGDPVVRSLRKEAHPGPARASMIADVSSMSGGQHRQAEPIDPSAVPSLEGVANQAATAIREATAGAIDQQWRQTVAILDHSLSRQILTSSIETSISASKEMTKGLDSLLRG